LPPRIEEKDGGGGVEEKDGEGGKSTFLYNYTR